MAAWQVGLLSATSLIAAAFCTWGVIDIVREARKGRKPGRGPVSVADAVEVRR